MVVLQPETDHNGAFIHYDANTQHPLDDADHPLYHCVLRDKEGYVRVDSDPFD